MIPAAFDYVRPASLSEALSLLAEGDGSQVLAGGQSLLPLLKLRVAEVGRLVDVGSIPELHGISEGADGGLVIGATTTYREILDSTLVAERCPLLVDVVTDIGDLQVRNLGTIGGSLALAHPAADLPAGVLALDASIVLRSDREERVAQADSFFVGPFTTQMEPGELLTEVRIPPQPDAAGWSYQVLRQPASGYATVGVTVVLGRSGGAISHIRVGATGVGEVAYRATATENVLAGSTDARSAIESAAAVVTEGQMISADIHADEVYRAAMAVVYARRALEAALDRAG
jgi:carbon-monoxide dehydrogenase medium subunit